ncbi:MAG: hypothetical protein K6T88_15505, partial [Bacillus sp. (in: Bacteria)]|nr:hypothetical protein [Bacillus sp. (in: firmicutes)]
MFKYRLGVRNYPQQGMAPDTFLFIKMGLYKRNYIKFDGRQSFKMEKALLLKYKEKTNEKINTIPKGEKK